ncbi:MAG: hypothetical protein MUO40_10900 [Anaerolineaceae bacterium]|nr:hypothetical protein [Anaerolineaceae bacterium]
MHILLTTCCKEKDPAPGTLPAIKRYLSKRIAHVYDESITYNIPMRILSGKFGLLSPDAPIPNYDHPLSTMEVPMLLPHVMEQLDQDSISAITFYAHPRQTPGWEPYYQVVEQSCKALSIKFEIEIV